jgi:hypothetical protein
MKKLGDKPISYNIFKLDSNMDFIRFAFISHLFVYIRISFGCNGDSDTVRTARTAYAFLHNIL